MEEKKSKPSIENSNRQIQKEKAACEECSTSAQDAPSVPAVSFVSKHTSSAVDYNMLEDMKRVSEPAQRTRLKLCGKSNFKLPFPLKSLRSAAASRGTKLLFLTNGMSKREMNRTYYDKRKKFVSWTIEWQFHSTDVVVVDHGVHENTYLCSVIENHLKDGPWNHRLRQFCNESLDSLKFFIRKYPKGRRSPYRKLNIKAPILEQLANLVILEYPVIHTVDADYPSPKGVTFREEEFEDGGSSNPLISDLTNHSNQNMVAQTEFKESIFSPLVVRGDEQDKSVLTSGGSVWKEEEYYIGKDLGIPEEDMNFDWSTYIQILSRELIRMTSLWRKS
ncbi:unnamed protein product [Fraxinus pennsylvanica]|uniref:BCD1 alpha/beta domain-containing protein n=1 Tax=Fraxinus pennsylvanica TaxID=56036 RepID=A0AAD2DVP4_9LAMI|nr:unnamed protein product [Fraxinus pennsylvanica]